MKNTAHSLQDRSLQLKGTLCERANENLKLNYKRTILVGLAFMSLSAFWTFYDQAIPVLLESIFKQSTLVTNIIMSADNILALFMLPIFGWLSDRTNTRLGKRTPYVLWGTVGAVICYLGMALGIQLSSFWLFFFMLLFTLIAMGTYRSPAVALMPDVTPRRHRSRANAIINLMGVVGGAVSLVCVMLLVKSGKNAEGATVYENQNFWPVFIAIGAFMLVSVIVYVFTVREGKLLKQLEASGELNEPEEEADENAEDEHTNIAGIKLPRPVFRSLIFILLAVACWYIAYNGVTTNLSRYCQHILGKDLSGSTAYVLVTMVLSTIAFMPLGILSAKLGRKKMILAGIALMGGCLLAASFITGPVAEIFLYLIFAGVGIGWAAINVNSYPMVVEIAKNGDVGKYTGYYYTFSMAAQVVTPLLTGFLIDKRYIGLSYRALFPYAFAFMVLAAVCMLFVKHGDSKPESKGLLESFADND